MALRVMVFIGTRPEGIKMAPVIRALVDAPDFEPIVVNTGQHRAMLQQVIDLFDLPVHHDLNVMTPNQTLASLSGKLITSIDELLQRDRPDFALVQGDTTTVLMATLACFYRHVPVGHVEAGLRTGDLSAPFPEEANRVLASRLVSLHFPPTASSRDHLLREHVPASAITVTGNTVIDALLEVVERTRSGAMGATIRADLDAVLGEGWGGKPYVLITGHRRENFGRGFEDICEAIATLARQFTDHRFIYPVHLNPNVQKPVHERLGGLTNVSLIPPQDYLHFVALLDRCTLVLTDSGGVQEEAPSLGKPVLVMRDTTERPEAVDAGVAKLVGADAGRIVEHVSRLLSDRAAYATMSQAANPYGDGKAAQRIVTVLREHLQRGSVERAEVNRIAASAVGGVR